MTARPCTGCGDIIATGSRCPDCRPSRADRPAQTHVAYNNNARWKNLSKKLRQQQPWCTWCGTTTRLQTDHILPESVAPELAYAVENLRVLCSTCNNQRQATYTPAEAQTVYDRLVDTYSRKPTRTGRERVNTAATALQALGDTPPDQAKPMAGQARKPLHTPGGIG